MTATAHTTAVSHSPVITGVFRVVVCRENMEYPALYVAYAEYAERMYDESDDLVSVDMFTVPMDVDMTRLAEWADVG